MRRYWTLLMSLLALFAAGELSAQTDRSNVFPYVLFQDEPRNKWSVGVFGGNDNNEHIVNMTYASNIQYAAAEGKTYGVTVMYSLRGWLSACADLAYVEKNYDMTHKFRRDDFVISFMNTHMSSSYLLMPITARLTLGKNLRIYGLGGAYCGYWLAAQRSGQSLSVTYFIDGSESSTYFDEPYEFDTRRDNRFDAGWVYGFGARCKYMGLELSAEMRWYYGLTDVQKQYMTNLNPRYNTTKTIQIGLNIWIDQLSGMKGLFVKTK